jgi:Domain of unknown function (DUF4112)
MTICSLKSGSRMLGNVALDRVLGSVPLVRDAFDVPWRANRRNVQLLLEWLEHERRRRRTHQYFARCNQPEPSLQRPILSGLHHRSGQLSLRHDCG